MLNQWFPVNEMSLNASETKSIMFHSWQKKVQPVNMDSNETHIDFNYSGILLDIHLSRKIHLNVFEKEKFQNHWFSTPLKHACPNTFY